MDDSKVLIVYTDEIGSSARQAHAKRKQVINNTASHFAAVIDTINESETDTRVIKNVGDSLIVRFSSIHLLSLLGRFADLKARHKRLRIGIHCADLSEIVINEGTRELALAIEQKVKTGTAGLSRWPKFKTQLKDDIFGHDMNLAARISSLPRGNFLVISQSVYDTLVDQVSKDFPGGDLWKTQLVDPEILNQALVEKMKFVVSQPFPVVYMKGLKMFDVAHPTFMYEVLSRADRCRCLRESREQDEVKKSAICVENLCKVSPPFPLAVEQKQYRVIYEVTLHVTDGVLDNDILNVIRQRYARSKLMCRTIDHPKKMSWRMPHPEIAFLDCVFAIYGVCEIDFREKPNTRGKTGDQEEVLRKQAKDIIRNALANESLFKRESGLLPSFLLFSSFPDANAEEAFRCFLDLGEGDIKDTFSHVRSLHVWDTSKYEKLDLKVSEKQELMRINCRQQPNEGIPIDDAPLGKHFVDNAMFKTGARETDTSSSDHVLILFRMTVEACHKATSMKATFDVLEGSNKNHFGWNLISYGLLRGAWDGYLLYRIGQGSGKYVEVVAKIIAEQKNVHSFLRKKVDFCRIVFLRQLVYDAHVETNWHVLSVDGS
jgi:class 3 adenylate cyclase